MSATVDLTVFFDAMADDPAMTVATHRRQLLDRAFETVENISFARHFDFEVLVILIAALIAWSHGFTPVCPRIDGDFTGGDPLVPRPECGGWRFPVRFSGLLAQHLQRALRHPLELGLPGKRRHEESRGMMSRLEGMIEPRAVERGIADVKPVTERDATFRADS